jgi:hypothetical protein
VTLTGHAKGRMHLRLINKKMIDECINCGVKKIDKKGIVYKNKYIQVVTSLDKENILTVKFNEKVEKKLKIIANYYGTSIRFAALHYFGSRGVI